MQDRNKLKAGCLTGFLEHVSSKIRRLGAEFEPDAARLQALRRRLLEQRCYLAVLGQFKRGKSTLINALLGEAVLPTGVLPLTSIPTFLQGGEQLSARVFFENAGHEQVFASKQAGQLGDFLSRFVTEKANPKNRLGVRSVEVTHPASLLAHGLVLIDTPGIGSTFRHNTEATINFLPQCDAALFVVSADPPITEVEVEFLKLARRRLPRIFFILNKIDYLDPSERSACVAFLQQVLCDQVGFAAPPPILCTSARHGMAALGREDATAWHQSGLSDIQYQIANFVSTEKAEVLRQAISRQTKDILADVKRRLELTLHALKLPLAELDERIRLFEESLTEIDEQRIVAMHRLSRDEEKLSKRLKERADQLLPGAMQFLKDIVKDCEKREGSKWSEQSTAEAIAAAIPGFFEHEYGALQEICKRELQEAMLPHSKRVLGLISSVHHLIEKLFNVPFSAQPHEIAFTVVDRPYWRTHKWAIKLGSIPESFIDGLLPRRWREARIRRRILEQVDYLASRNVGDLQFSLLENLNRSIETFRDALNRDFEQAANNTRNTLNAACRLWTGNSDAVAAEAGRLESALGEIRAIREDLRNRSQNA